MVDLGNAISLKYYLPVGAHDLDTMDGEFCVRCAGEDDTFLPFGGTETEKADIGEVDLCHRHKDKNPPLDMAPK